MGLRFHRTVRAGKLARLNIGLRGISLSLGRPGATVNVGRDGVRSTVGLPGTGLSYRSEAHGSAGGMLVVVLLRLLLVFGLLALLALALFGCTSGPVVRDGYEWMHDPALPVCSAVQWVQEPWEVHRERCGGLACTIGCTVYSGYSEADAKVVPAGLYATQSLFDHEMLHATKQLNHPKRGNK